jgi:hypothetical protein
MNAPESTLWTQTLQAAASKNVPTTMERIRESPFTPAIVAAFAVFFILVWLKPQFVQRKQCSKIALPSLNYSAVFALSTLAFLGVLVIPKII